MKLKDKIKKTTNKKLDEQIDSLVDKLNDENLTIQERSEYEQRIKTLVEIKNGLKLNKRDIPIAQIVTTAGSILSVLLILNYEKVDIVTSKALGLVGKKL